jgi:hypothetical protein
MAVEGLWTEWSLSYRGVVLGALLAGEIAAFRATALGTEDGPSVVKCSSKLGDARIWDDATCAQRLTDVLGVLTTFGLIVGLVAVLVPTLARRQRRGDSR